MSNPNELIEDVFEGFGVFEASPGADLPRLLPDIAIHALEIWCELLQRLFFAVELHHLPAAQFLVLLFELRFLGL